MKKIKGKKIVRLAAVLALLFCFFEQEAKAEVFDLSYSLTEGGYRLDLDPANPYKGVKIEVNSDVAVRYEIIQRVITPLENRDRPGSLIEDNFVFRGLRGTNQFGDFRIYANDIPVRSDEVIYVSNTAGSSDNFTLVYGINRVEDIEPGHYFGRISFTLNPIGSARTLVTKFLDVYVTISEQGQTKPRIEISAADGARTIALNPRKDQMQTADITVKINGTFRKPFSIIQMLAQPIESQEGIRLDAEAVNFVVSEAKKGMSINQTTPLSSGMQNIYTSGPGGEADGYFVISYGLGDFSGQKAGKYRSRIQYILDEMDRQTKLDTLQLEIENERIFDLTITPADQKFAIEFLNVKPTEPPRQSEVIIEVMTNIGKQYQVNQEVYSELTNKEGEAIAAQYFSLHTEGIDITRGKLRFPMKEEVKKGSTVLFISDLQGSPDKFKVIYELECPKDLRAGDYATRITYSLLEI